MFIKLDFLVKRKHNQLGDLVNAPVCGKIGCDGVGLELQHRNLHLIEIYMHFSKNNLEKVKKPLDKSKIQV